MIIFNGICKKSSVNQNQPFNQSSFPYYSNKITKLVMTLEESFSNVFTMISQAANYAAVANWLLFRFVCKVSYSMFFSNYLRFSSTAAT